ncbi:MULTISPECIES: terminase small subunit [Pseudomonas]|uniref:Phage terminase small subunit n=1 Tax=Pseudomonas lutea TaxID=243924 RepID=A0A9X8MH49_9PSED|nr:MULTISPECIES: terminase small subunit [Pseudomonas]SER37084.1 phage terminase small subunit [Pseudomonas lutea]
MAAKKSGQATAKPKPRKTTTKKPQAQATPIEPVKLTEEQILVADMDPRHVKFVDAYLQTYNQTKAYQAAGFEAVTPNSACVLGGRLLKTVNVIRLLALRTKAMFDDSEDLRTRALQSIVGLAFADPNELTEHRRECCRHCYGENHEYQFKPAEFKRHQDDYEEAVKKAIRDEIEPPDFDPKGGIGYDPRRPPIESCPECFGEGIDRLVLKDTRDLSPAAQLLYAGVKQTKDGIEVLTHDQTKARDLLYRILKLTEPEEAKVVAVLDPDKLDAIYEKAAENALKGRLEVEKRRDELKAMLRDIK